MHMSGLRPSKKFYMMQKDGKNGFVNNPKPDYKPKGQSAKNVSRRRGNI